MKKIITLIILATLILPVKIYAAEGDIVSLSNCVDSESARFMQGVGEIKVKFIGIQLEEKVIDSDDDEINGSFISDYVCSVLTNGKQIRIEYEPNIEKEDKYGRIQAWVFVDDVLLQEDLIKNGYAKPMYLEENYLYYNNLKVAQKYAKDNKLGIWSEEEKTEEPKPEKEEKKSKGIIETIIDFFKSIINAICEFVDSIIKNIL